ncbi:MAG: hypothetical protein AAF560_26045, partial [Acidobacteriota bacterium]
MATAYFINASPVKVTITLNGGRQHDLDAISVADDGKAIKGPAWGAAIEEFPAREVLGGGRRENEFTFRGQIGTTKYHIYSSVPIVRNLYFFMFEDRIVGEDDNGNTKDITIEDDLIEEVGRMFRYDNIPEVPLRSVVEIPHREEELYLTREIMRIGATELSCHEVYNYSFVAEAVIDAVEA